MTTTTATARECSKCGKNGKIVKPVTVRALLKNEYAAEVAVPDKSVCESGCKPSTGNTGWRFCDSPECDVVYFGEQNEVTFTKNQLWVSVGVKEKTGERPLCYCFGHSVATIMEELRTKGRSDAQEDIRRKMKDPGCACEVKNPSGSCCIGAVAKGIEAAKAELKSTTSSGNKAETISKMGTILSAVMASSCCWLPLVLLAFGVSGAGIAGVLDTYRPVFIVLTFGFLAAAFYFTYRSRQSLATEGDCCSTKHDCCAVPNENAKRRFSMLTLNKALLWVVTLLAILFLFFPKYVGFFLTSQHVESESTATNPLVRKTAIAIEGMNCEGCSAALQTALVGVSGVLNARVDFKNKQVVVSTEACCPFPKEEILKAVQDSGFSGSVADSQ
ncbi:MAG: cation transporter [Planctomycetes bacterium]|nr:cation transporter [Planctomycetota bacterium]